MGQSVLRATPIDVDVPTLEACTEAASLHRIGRTSLERDGTFEQNLSMAANRDRFPRWIADSVKQIEARNKLRTFAGACIA